MTRSVFCVAHRTNSAAAAAKFVTRRLTHVEMDVRMIGGRVVLSHYQKVTWAPGWLERDNLRVRPHGWPTIGVPIDEVVPAIPPHVVIVFDPKDREPELRAQLAKTLTGIVDDPARHIVSSRRDDDIDTFGTAGFRTWRTLDRPEQIREVSSRAQTVDGFTVRQRVLTAEAIHDLHAVTDTVVAWTVNSVPRALELAALGVDGITTDRLAVMSEVRGGPA